MWSIEQSPESYLLGYGVDALSQRSRCYQMILCSETSNSLSHQSVSSRFLPRSPICRAFKVCFYFGGDLGGGVERVLSHFCINFYFHNDL